MKTVVPRWTVVIAAVFLLASCGSSGGGGEVSCTSNGVISLLSTTSGTPLLSTTVTVTRDYTPEPSVPVFVAYTSPPVAAILAGYPPGTTDPRTIGVNIAALSPTTANPLAFMLSFNTTLIPDTYHATWRFVAVDAGSNVAGCVDLPVTFTVH